MDHFGAIFTHSLFDYLSCYCIVYMRMLRDFQGCRLQNDGLMTFYVLCCISSFSYLFYPPIRVNSFFNT